MPISMLDQMLFRLPCGHDVVVGRLENQSDWTCDECGSKYDLTSQPTKGALDRELDTANQIDLQVKERGGTIERAR